MLPQDPSTGEMEEESTDENGLLSLEPAEKHHSGLYQCQSLDLETTITLSSDPLELLVNCEALGWMDAGSVWAKGELALPVRLTFFCYASRCV